MGDILAYYDALRSVDKGYVADLYGERYDVRRLDIQTDTAILANFPVINEFRSRIHRITSREIIEAAPFDLVAYEAECDKTNLRLGDLLTESADSPGGLGVSYYFVQAREAREVVWMRADFTMSIWRPKPEGGGAADEPQSGSVFDEGYGGTPEISEMVLTLAGGTYSWSDAPNAIPAAVQCGMQPTSRTSPNTELGTPTDLPQDRFSAYIPPLPEVQLRVGDRLTTNDLNVNRYEIQHVFLTPIGFAGYVCVCTNAND
jgi:hypothetical protein